MRTIFSLIACLMVLATPGSATAQAGPSKTEVTTKDYNFAYSYPAAAARIAPLKAWLDADRANARAMLVKYVAEGKHADAASDRDFNGYDSSTNWGTVTETPRLLSLSAETYDYTGGAHGSPGFRALVWDKIAKRRLDPLAVFVSPDALQRAVATPFCRQIDVERAKKRGTQVARSRDPFDTCPKASETTVVLGSSNRRAINRIGFLIGPYVAGPYVEGTYEVTLPVTRAVLKAVKPEFRRAFAVR